MKTNNSRTMNCNENANPLAFLNILRFIACIAISVLHTMRYLTVEQINAVPILQIINDKAELLVEMFFIISGMMFLLHYYEKLNTSKSPFSSFFKNRIIRIYPLMTIVTLLCFLLVVVSSFVSQQSKINFTDLTVTLLLGSPCVFTGKNSLLNGVTWYISVLILCYLVACFIVAVTKKCKSKQKVFLFAIPMLLGAGMQIPTITVPFFNHEIGRGLFSFFFGVFLMKYLLYLRKSSKKHLIAVKLFALIIFSIFIGLETQTALLSGNNSMPFTLFFYAPIIIVLYNLKYLNRFSSTKAIKLCGAISFNIYLLNGLFARLGDCTLACCSFSFKSLSYWSILIALSFEIVLGVITYFLINKKLTGYLISKFNKA